MTNARVSAWLVVVDILRIVVGLIMVIATLGYTWSAFQSNGPMAALAVFVAGAIGTAVYAFMTNQALERERNGEDVNLTMSIISSTAWGVIGWLAAVLLMMGVQRGGPVVDRVVAGLFSTNTGATTLAFVEQPVIAPELDPSTLPGETLLTLGQESLVAGLKDCDDAVFGTAHNDSSATELHADLREGEQGVVYSADPLIINGHASLGAVGISFVDITVPTAAGGNSGAVGWNTGNGRWNIHACYFDLDQLDWRQLLKDMQLGNKDRGGSDAGEGKPAGRLFTSDGVEELWNDKEESVTYFSSTP